MRPAALLALLLLAGCVTPFGTVDAAKDCRSGAKPDLLTWTHTKGGLAGPNSSAAATVEGRVDHAGHVVVQTLAHEGNRTYPVRNDTRDLDIAQYDALCAALLTFGPHVQRDAAGDDCDELRLDASTARGDWHAETSCPATAAGRALQDAVARLSSES